MKFLIFAAACALPALALPEPVSGDVTLAARDNVKLNQYRTMDDCENDRDILFHSAPASGKCVELDDQTGAFFYNTGGFWQSYCEYSTTSRGPLVDQGEMDTSSHMDIAYDNHGCGGTAHKFQRYTGRCVERGTQNSVKFS